jgi:mevalonate kinase
MLNGEDGVTSELNLGVGWQDPAIITETGLCVWESGQRPKLHLKRNGDMLQELMALRFTDIEHDTPAIADKNRDYERIYQAGLVAADAVLRQDVPHLGEAVRMSYQAQLAEGMAALDIPTTCLAAKYCGGGWGGYALYLFSSPADRDEFVGVSSCAKAIEPFIRYEKNR